MAASIGDLNAVLPNFQCVQDVPLAGVLFALPALLSNGLLDHHESFFQLPKGFYGIDSIFLLLAFMALCRVKTIERLRYCAPGEWGKIIGLDRISEVRTLRQKIQILVTDNSKVKQWGETLCQQWMEASPTLAGVLYIDGHVRVYNGHQTKLPRHHVSRQKLCLRATTDYWVNAAQGAPFFVVNQAVDPGMIKVIEKDILPRLERDIPDQPTPEQLLEKPLLHRFTLIFDREGYSPSFFKRMREKQVACATYHKFPGEDWPEDAFHTYQVTARNGELSTLKLAERGTRLSNNLWVREVRKLSHRGHQTSVISTDYQSNLDVIGMGMFARWSQENFFKYMRQHYSLDTLSGYAVEDIPETTKVVNPKHRSLDGEVRRHVAKLSKRLAEFGALNFDDPIEPDKAALFLQKKTDLHEEIESLKVEVTRLKKERKETARHIPVNELPEEEQFKQLSTRSKYLIDTLKMIAYRAESAMANILRDTMSHPDEARSLLAALYQTEADIHPDESSKTLTVSLHHMPTHSADRSIQALCDELNATETIFPRTELRMIFKLGSK